MKNKLAAGIACFIAMAVSGCSDNTPAASSSDEVTTLRFSHFMNANDNINTEGFEPWVKKIEEESNGRLKIEIYPSATLSKPGATYEAAAKGTVDIGMQVQGYTAGRFPLTQVVDCQVFLILPSSKLVSYMNYIMTVLLLVSTKIPIYCR